MLRQMFEAFMKYYGFDMDKFVEYYERSSWWSCDLEEYLSRSCSRDWVAGAFEWSDTEEGYDYWYDVEGLWSEWLDEDLG